MSLNVSDLTVGYDTGNASSSLAIDSLSFSIPKRGYTIGLVGESGCGKTTLGMSILNLIPSPGRIKSGRIEFEGEDVLSFNKTRLNKYRGGDVAMIYQSAMNSLNPVMTVIQHLEEALVLHKKVEKKEARDASAKMLHAVGIREERFDHYPHEFSGGMRQRVVIAMALALSPQLLIADEPTSALDVVVQQQILGLIAREVKDRNLSMIFITHDLAILRGVVDYVAVMYAGKIVEVGPISKILRSPEHPYTQLLMSSLLTMNVDRSRSINSLELGGPVTEPPQGELCNFSNRCKFVFDRCKREVPKLLETQRESLVACHKYH